MPTMFIIRTVTMKLASLPSGRCANGLRKGRVDMYAYGMRLRGFSMGCQPMNGLVERQDDLTGKYWDVLFYNRKLTDREQTMYELDYMGETEDDL